MFSDKFGEFELIRWKAMTKSEKEVLVDFFYQKLRKSRLNNFRAAFYVSF